ncbi:hypothetical protein HK100_010688 [Physocladia obscura]|uniref:Uncharacterized protein n=1 Tax=Physocladia obscura TaxID=109957 RepID=A0AAD5XHM7_9FUNG|nr:hypothetical protein HK100_010688 [Physocladia obscura]
MALVAAKTHLKKLRSSDWNTILKDNWHSRTDWIADNLRSYDWIVLLKNNWRPNEWITLFKDNWSTREWYNIFKNTWTEKSVRLPWLRKIVILLSAIIAIRALPWIRFILARNLWASANFIGGSRFKNFVAENTLKLSPPTLPSARVTPPAQSSNPTQLQKSTHAPPVVALPAEYKQYDEEDFDCGDDLFLESIEYSPRSKNGVFLPAKPLSLPKTAYSYAHSATDSDSTAALTPTSSKTSSPRQNNPEIFGSLLADTKFGSAKSSVVVVVVLPPLLLVDETEETRLAAGFGLKFGTRAHVADCNALS